MKRYYKSVFFLHTPDFSEGPCKKIFPQITEIASKTLRKSTFEAYNATKIPLRGLKATKRNRKHLFFMMENIFLHTRRFFQNEKKHCSKIRLWWKQTFLFLVSKSAAVFSRGWNSGAGEGVNHSNNCKITLNNREMRSKLDKNKENQLVISWARNSLF